MGCDIASIQYALLYYGLMALCVTLNFEGIVDLDPTKLGWILCCILLCVTSQIIWEGGEDCA